MNSWQFFLDDIEIEQPEGFTDLTLQLSRDPDYYGIFFSASEIQLGFYGWAADYLQAKKNAKGIAATAVFKAITTCGGQLEVAAGNLDFTSYRETCGTRCAVYMPIENTGCLMKFRNNINTPIDVDSIKALNQQTVLQQYNALGIDIELPPQELKAAVNGYVVVDYDASNIVAVDELGGSGFVAIRPVYARELYNNINQGQLIPDSNYFTTINEFSLPLSPQLLYDDTISCFPGLFSILGRMKGTLDVSAGGIASTITGISIVLATWDGVGNFFADYVVLDSFEVYAGGADTFNGSFDHSINYPYAIPAGQGVYYFIQIGVSSVGGQFLATVTYDADTYIDISANKSCPATTAQVYMVHELASRICEAMTDGCLVVRSDYYGRTDSQPFATAMDGCGSLRALSSGLKIRKAENAKFFTTWAQFLKGLRGIDNAGIGLEDHPTLPALGVMRLEPMEYFYQDTQLMTINLIPDGEILTDIENHYSLVNIGYEKWQAESVNGLDEFNSQKKYRATHGAVDKTLDALSTFVAGGYPLEVTRQASYAATGAADTSFDNDTFVICLQRNGYSLEVEQGNIINASGMYSPGTAYNWRIRPFYNLMRWWKAIAHMYKNLLNTESRLAFSSGEGNLVAAGELPVYDPCKLEAGTYAENADLTADKMATGSTPIFNGETFSFKYPLTLQQFNQMRAAPYGYLKMQCGNGGYMLGYIETVQYNLFEGQADIKTRLKWQ